MDWYSSNIEMKDLLYMEWNSLKLAAHETYTVKWLITSKQNHVR